MFNPNFQLSHLIISFSTVFATLYKQNQICRFEYISIVMSKMRLMIQTKKRLKPFTPQQSDESGCYRLALLFVVYLWNCRNLQYPDYMNIYTLQHLYKSDKTINQTICILFSYHILLLLLLVQQKSFIRPANVAKKGQKIEITIINCFFFRKVHAKWMNNRKKRYEIKWK